jgi:hypothetical protein
MALHEFLDPDKIEASASSSSEKKSFESEVNEKLKRIADLLEELLTQRASSSSAAEETAPLRLGPFPLRDPAPDYKPATEDYSLERTLKAAHRHAILTSWARDWWHKMQQFGWKDSYGGPVRSIERYLCYSWRLQCKANPSLKERGKREAEKHHYADFAKDGSEKPPAMLPEPPTDKDWKQRRDDLQKAIEQVRRTA